MAKQKPDGISWTDYTLNLWWGCVRIGGDPACGPTEEFPDGAVCYAETLADLYGWNDRPAKSGKPKTMFPIWGAHQKRRFFAERPLHDLGKINRDWGADPLVQRMLAGRMDRARRARVFVMSMGDWAEGRPDQQEPLARLWAKIASCRNVNLLMLTKRTGLISKLCPYSTSLLIHPLFGGSSKHLFETSKRVWQGTTVVTQKWADIRIPQLLDAIHDEQIGWLSIEPQMEEITLPKRFLDRGRLSWVVVGGQSGSKAATYDAAWGRRLRDQCNEAGVPFHFKQMSGNTKAQLKAIPPDLMTREWPEDQTGE